MNSFGLTFHNLGLVVRRPSEATKFLSAPGYSIGEPVFDSEQKVTLDASRMRWTQVERNAQLRELTLKVDLAGHAR